MTVRGPALCSGYVRNADGNRLDFRDGWFRTRDIFDRHDGTYSFISRRKYLIKSGGENFYPAENEEIITQHDAVSKVIVVRADDPDCGEVPRAVAGVDDPEDPVAFRTQLMDTNDEELARYKLPHSIKFVDQGCSTAPAPERSCGPKSRSGRSRTPSEPGECNPRRYTLALG